MSKNTNPELISQQLPLLERKEQGWQIRRGLSQKQNQISRHYTTREVVDLLKLPSRTPLYQAKRRGTAYLHNPGNLENSRIVVAVGLRDKWLIYKLDAA